MVAVARSADSRRSYVWDGCWRLDGSGEAQPWNPPRESRTADGLLVWEFFRILLLWLKRINACYKPKPRDVSAGDSQDCGAEGGTRTPTSYLTRPSNVRVYQFRHFGIRVFVNRSQTANRSGYLFGAGDAPVWGLLAGEEVVSEGGAVFVGALVFAPS